MKKNILFVSRVYPLDFCTSCPEESSKATTRESTCSGGASIKTWKRTTEGVASIASTWTFQVPMDDSAGLSVSAFGPWTLTSKEKFQVPRKPGWSGAVSYAATATSRCAIPRASGCAAPIRITTQSPG